MKRWNEIPKIVGKLSRALGPSMGGKAGAVGVLELLRLFVEEQCPAGDIGKFGYDHLADFIHWPYSLPIDLLIKALGEAGVIRYMQPKNQLFIHPDLMEEAKSEGE